MWPREPSVPGRRIQLWFFEGGVLLPSGGGGCRWGGSGGRSYVKWGDMCLHTVGVGCVSSFVTSGVMVRKLACSSMLLVPTCSRILPHAIRLSAGFSHGVRLGVPFMATTVSAIARTPVTVTVTHRKKVNIVRGGVSVRRRTHRITVIGHTRGKVVCSPIAVGHNHAMKSTLGVVDRCRVKKVPMISSSGGLMNVIAGHSLHFRRGPSHGVSRMVASRGLIAARLRASLSTTTGVLRRGGVRGLPIISVSNHLINLVACGSVAGTGSGPVTYGSRGKHLHITTNINIARSALSHVHTLIRTNTSTVVVSATRKRSGCIVRGLGLTGTRFPRISVIINGITAKRTTGVLIRTKTSNVGINVNPNSVYAAHIMTNINIPRLSTICSITYTLRKAKIPLVTSNNLHCSNSVIGTLTTNNCTIVVNSLITKARRSPNSAVVFGKHGFGSCHNVNSLRTVRYNSGSHCFRSSMGSIGGLIPRNVTNHIPCGNAIRRIVFRLVKNLHSNVKCYNTGAVRRLRGTGFIEVAGTNILRDRPRSIVVADRTPGCDHPRW